MPKASSSAKLIFNSSIFMTSRLSLRLAGVTLATLFAAACSDETTAPVAPDLAAPRMNVTPTAQLGNFVWHDLNANGIQDAGEPGIPGAQITLTTPAGSFTGPSGPNGEYLAQGLSAGSYKVCVATPSGYSAPSPSSQGGNNIYDSDGSGPQNCVTVSLVDGESDLDIDFGFYKNAAVGDFVWYDQNGNGVQDGGEPGIPGATVTLAGPSGPLSMVTGPNGEYLFANIRPGSYDVCVDVPTGYSAASLALQGGDQAKDSNGSGTPNCADVTLVSGQTDLTIDFGFTISRASLGDFVWHDLNADGVQDSGEPGIQGATVTLNGPSGPQSMQTNANGAYGFTNLLPGAYTVCTAMPAGFTRVSAALQGGDGTLDSDGAGTQNCASVTLAPGESNPTIDFGFYKLGALGDFVWNDANSNGIQDATEVGIGNVTVTLNGPGGAQSTTTNSSGGYSFTGLVPGAYTVCVNVPAGFSAPSPDMQGGNTAKDSDGSGTPNCDTVILASGETNNTIDFGFTIVRASLGDFVWHDKNANGVQDAGEPGIEDAVVTLAGPSGPQSVNTNASGDYAFNNLLPGTYTVCVAMPAGYTHVSPALQGNPTTDSNGPGGASNCSTVTLAAGDNNTTIDFGFYSRVSLGDFVWHDLNANGVQDLNEPGISGATVTANGPSGSLSTTTNAAGEYAFTNLLPGTYTVCAAMPSGYTQISLANQGGDNAKDSNGAGAGNCTSTTLMSGDNDTSLDFGFYKLASLGDYVWQDVDKDGTQNTGDLAIAGAAVSLNGPGGAQNGTTNTSGIYGFTNLKPGSYTVCVPVPVGMSLATTAFQGGDQTKDSNGTGSPNCYTVQLNSGDNNLTIDFGFTKAAIVQQASVGDLVWHDQNANGVQDAGEPGIGGVTVTLNGPGGAQTMQTTSAGNYMFTGLAAGTYTICVATPATYQGISPANQGGDNTKDSNGSGTPNCSSVTLAAGQTNITIDFGFYKLGSIGDFVWYDKDDDGIQDATETGISGRTVTLTGPNGTSTTTTNSSGKYLFSGLKPGTYTVCTGIPSGYHSSPAAVGNDREKDSNGTGNPSCAQVVLASGEANLSIDFGFDCGTTSPTLASVGDFVWRDNNSNGIQDSGEPGIKGATVTITGNGVNKSMVTDSYGKYLFTNLNPGTYTICVPTVSGLIPTGANKGSYDSKDSDGTGAGNCTSVTLAAGQNNTTIDFGFDCAPAAASLKGYVWNDANMNGIQNTGESAISGRTVTLSGPSGPKTTATDSYGKYTFSNLAPGSYTICVAVPTNYAASPANQGTNESVDSDGAGTANCATVTLAAGEQKVDPDFGIYCKPVLGSIGSFVWNDLNKNGIQNSGEAGIGGRTVTLSGPSGSKTATTDGNGKYSFTNLAAGTYTVCVSAPSGYTVSPADLGGDENLDSDGKGTGNCASVTLVAGQTNNSMDFGFYCTPLPASVGSLVWYDRDWDGIQDSDEVGMSGRVVTIKGTNVNKTATTDSYGKYSFGNLAAGSYTLCVATPSGYKASPSNRGYYDSKDSDGSGTGNCVTVSLTAGQNNTSIDFGFDKSY